MTFLLYIVTVFIVGFLLAAGFYSLAFLIPGITSSRTKKTITAILKQQKAANVKSDYSSDIILFISKFIHINTYKRQKLIASLKIANISATPETYYANAVFQFFKYSLLAIPFLFFFPIFAILPLILAVLQFFKASRQVYTFIKEKRKQIELDLPRLVYAISHELKSNHDVLSILERHNDGLSRQFSEEIGITIADMRTGNYEAALLRLEGRIGSTLLSEVVRGFIEMVNGNDTQIYWETLAFKFSEIQKQDIRKEATKVPARVRRLSFCLLVAIMLTYGVVLGSQLVNNIGILF